MIVGEQVAGKRKESGASLLSFFPHCDLWVVRKELVVSIVLEEMYVRRELMKKVDPDGYKEMLKEAAEIEENEVEDKYDDDGYLHWTEIDWELPGEAE